MKEFSSSLSCHSPASVAAQHLQSSLADCDYVFDNFSSLFQISFKNVQVPPTKDPSKSLIFIFESIAVQDIRKKLALKENQLSQSQLFSQPITQSQKYSSDMPRSDSSIMKGQKEDNLQKIQQEIENSAKSKQNNLVITQFQARRLSISITSPQVQQSQYEHNNNNNNNNTKQNQSNDNNSQLLNARNTHSRAMSDISFLSNQSGGIQNAEDCFKSQQQKEQLLSQMQETQAPTLPSNLTKHQKATLISYQPKQTLKHVVKGYSKRKVLKISSKPSSLIDPCQILHQHPPQITQIESSILKPNPSSCTNAILSTNPSNSTNYYTQNTGNFGLKNETSKQLQNTQPITKKVLPAIEDFNKTGKITNNKENKLTDTKGYVLDLTKNNPSIFSGTTKSAVPSSLGNSVRSIFPATTTSQENNKKPLILATITSKHQNYSNNLSQTNNGFTSNNNNKLTKINNIKLINTTNNKDLDSKIITTEDVRLQRLPSCNTNKSQGEQYPDQNPRYNSKTRNSSRDNSVNGMRHLKKDSQQSQNNHMVIIKNLVNPDSSSIKQEAVIQSLIQNDKLYGSKTANQSFHQNGQVSNIRA